jgi:chemotaxis protein MotB
MAAGRRRKGGGGGGHEGPDERWLLTYADMITLLMALFIVMFAISVVNTSKFEALSKSLSEAFNGAVVTGGDSILETGGSQHSTQSPTVTAPIPAIQPLIQKKFDKKTEGSKSKDDEQAEFEKVKRELDSYAKEKNLSKKLETEITRRGLVIRLITDNVLFDSGEADIKPGAKPLLSKVSNALQVADDRPINVEGHTDNVPIHGSQYPTNWELSTARSSSVVRFMIGRGIPASKLGAVGYAQLHPIASNDTAKGKSRNRRVEIVLLRTEDSADETP